MQETEAQNAAKWKAALTIFGLGDRSSRSLAIFRLAMVALYGIWFQIDFSRIVPVTSLLMGTYWLYFIVSSVLFLLSINSWWYDFRLSMPSFFIDIYAFVTSLLVIDILRSDFFSPVFALFIFLLISAFVRWSQKVMPAVAAVLGIFLLSAGLAVHWMGEPIDLGRTIQRFSYLVLVALILTRFCYNRGAYVVPRMAQSSTEADKAPFDALLDYAMAASGARRAALVWSATDEPWTSAELAGAFGRRHLRISAGEEDEYAHGETAMFDAQRRRTLVLNREGRLIPARSRQGPALAAQIEFAEGIFCPLAGPSGSGVLLLGDIPAMSWEDIFVAENVAREVVVGLEELAAAAASRENAAVRLKTDLARDLHDSVAQSLAGARFRLETLRQSIAEGKVSTSEVDGISDALGREQAQVRDVINQLRQSSPKPGARDLEAELSAMALLLAESWGINFRIENTGPPVRTDLSMLFEIQQLVREAVSNAVRHGFATQVILAIAMEQGDCLDLTLEDDGIGFVQSAGLVRPRSISERVAALDGTLAVDSLNGRTQLRIRIPLKVER